MSAFGDIFAGFLGGAAQGYAEGESSRIQNMHRAQAQIAVNDATATRRANLEAIARQNQNTAFLSTLRGLSEEDRAELSRDLGDNWEQNLTSLASVDMEDANKRLYKALEREETEPTYNLPDSVVSGISGMLEIPEEDVRSLNPNMHSNLVSMWTSYRNSKSKLTDTAGAEVEEEVAKAEGDIRTFLNSFFPDQQRSDNMFPSTMLAMSTRMRQIGAERAAEGKRVTSDIVFAEAQAEFADIVGSKSTGRNSDIQDGFNAYLSFVGMEIPAPDDTGGGEGKTKPSPNMLSEDEVNAVVPERGISGSGINMTVDPALSLEDIDQTPPAKTRSALYNRTVNNYRNMDDQTYRSAVNVLMQRAGVVGMIANNPTPARGDDLYASVVEALRADDGYYTQLSAAAAAKGKSLAQLIKELYG